MKLMVGTENDVKQMQRSLKIPCPPEIETSNMFKTGVLTCGC